MLMWILRVPSLAVNSVVYCVDGATIALSLTLNAFRGYISVIHNALGARLNCAELPGGVGVKSVAPRPGLAIRVAAVIVIQALVRISLWSISVPMRSLKIPPLAFLARLSEIHWSSVTFPFAGYTFHFCTEWDVTGFMAHFGAFGETPRSSFFSSWVTAVVFPQVFTSVARRQKAMFMWNHGIP